MSNDYRKYIWWHIIGIFCFISLPILISPHPPGEKYLFALPTIRDFIANFLMILFFYGNYYWFIPEIFLKKKHMIYASIVCVAFIVIILLPSILTGHAPWQDLPAPPHVKMVPRPPESGLFSIVKQNMHNILLFLSVVLFSVLIRVRERLFTVERLKNQIEVSSLKNQINPHFLFNTLNAIYASALNDGASRTASNILKLSGLMRYTMENIDHRLVPLEKELNYINDYIQLQKMRLDEHTKLSYNISGNPAANKIAPLILIPFIENAFKHGVNPDKDSLIDIDIEIKAAHLLLRVSNMKVRATLHQHEKSGRGIENAKSRLKLLYPSAHTLSIKDIAEKFEVVLWIDLA